MNDGDAFVLDAGQRIFIYTGKNANRKEQFEAITVASLFKDEPGEAIVKVGMKSSVSPKLLASLYVRQTSVSDDGLELEQLTGQNLEVLQTGPWPSM